jgi:hypothetical protein
MKITYAIAMLLTLVLASFAATAEVFRWVDAQGRVHYSDRPTSEKAKVVPVESRPTNSEAVNKRSEAEQAQRQQDEKDKQKLNADMAANKAVAKDTAKLQEERCKKAQEAYRVAIESQRLYRLGKNGEREYLTAEEITAARVNARKSLDEACPEK